MVLQPAFAYVIWFAIHKYFGRWYDETEKVAEKNKKFWRIAQWVATGGLWWTWLSHDMANIAVFLPRVSSFRPNVLSQRSVRCRLVLYVQRTWW